MASGRGASSRWFFTREQLENTPSRRCGVEADKELSYRQQAANLIQDMGQRLNVYPFLFLALRRSTPCPPSLFAGSPGRRACCPANMAPPPRPSLGLGRAVREGRLGLWRPQAASEGGEERSPGMRAARLRCVIWGRAWWRRGMGVAPRPEGNLRDYRRKEVATSTSSRRRGREVGGLSMLKDVFPAASPRTPRWFDGGSRTLRAHRRSFYSWCGFVWVCARAFQLSDVELSQS